MTIRICLSALMLCIAVSAREMETNDAFKDAFEELENNNLTLRFASAMDDSPIAGATVTIKGQDPLITDTDGKCRFPATLKDGVYPVTIEKKGFVTSTFSIEIMVGSLFANHFSVSPSLDSRYVRIILDWGKKPRDLDAHFVKEDGYHISYRSKRSAGDGSAVLDRDDRDGYGPETITIKRTDADGKYEYYVDDYSNRKKRAGKKLSKSKARVTVIADGKQYAAFTIPRKVKGKRWVVFRIENGDIIEVNSLQQ